MIPFILVAVGGYLVGQSRKRDDFAVKKLSYGDYLSERKIESGDEVVFSYNDDSWLEIYDEGEFPTMEIPFQAGEAFEVVVYDMDDAHYHVRFEDGSVAFIPKDEVAVVAVNDEVSGFENGGELEKSENVMYSFIVRIYWADDNGNEITNSEIVEASDKEKAIEVASEKVKKEKNFSKINHADALYRGRIYRIGNMKWQLDSLEDILLAFGFKERQDDGLYKKFTLVTPSKIFHAYIDDYGNEYTDQNRVILTMGGVEILKTDFDISERQTNERLIKTLEKLGLSPKMRNTMEGGGKTKYWIKDAIKEKGALRRTAKREGLIDGDEKLSMSDLEKLEKKGGKTAQRARLAKTLKGLK